MLITSLFNTCTEEGLGCELNDLASLIVFFYIYTFKGYWLRDNKNTLKNIPLIARPCKEDSRRNISKGWRSSLLVSLVAVSGVTVVSLSSFLPKC